jgi:hypothetical protein
VVDELPVIALDGPDRFQIVRGGENSLGAGNTITAALALSLTNADGLALPWGAGVA